MYATRGIINNDSYYRTIISSGSETASDGSYESLLMTFSVVVLFASDPFFLPAMLVEVTNGRCRRPMTGPCTGIPLRWVHSEDYISRARCKPL
jgi:hypothetical protein